MKRSTDNELDALLREAGLSQETIDSQMEQPGYLADCARLQALFDESASQSPEVRQADSVSRPRWAILALAASLLLAIGASQWRVHESPMSPRVQRVHLSAESVVGASLAIADDEVFETEFDELQAAIGDPWGLAFDDSYGVDWSAEDWLEEAGEGGP